MGPALQPPSSCAKTAAIGRRAWSVDGAGGHASQGAALQIGPARSGHFAGFQPITTKWVAQRIASLPLIWPWAMCHPAVQPGPGHYPCCPQRCTAHDGCKLQADAATRGSPQPSQWLSRRYAPGLAPARRIPGGRVATATNLCPGNCRWTADGRPQSRRLLPQCPRVASPAARQTGGGRGARCGVTAHRAVRGIAGIATNSEATLGGGGVRQLNILHVPPLCKWIDHRTFPHQS